MLDRHDNDLIRPFVNAVIDEVGIAARDNFATACRRPAKGNRVSMLKVLRIAARTHTAAAGFFERM
jgi:hypothetical protein